MSESATSLQPVFLCYSLSDAAEKDGFVERFGDAFSSCIDLPVPGEAISSEPLAMDRTRQMIRDKHLKQSTVTVVLIGRKTWKSRRVDWEIAASLRRTPRGQRSGLLAIMLPSYSVPFGLPYAIERVHLDTDPPRDRANLHTLPPRLVDNLESGFAVLRPYPTSVDELADWVAEAAARRDLQPPPVNERARYEADVPDSRTYWSDV